MKIATVGIAISTLTLLSCNHDVRNRHRDKEQSYPQQAVVIDEIRNDTTFDSISEVLRDAQLIPDEILGLEQIAGTGIHIAGGYRIKLSNHPRSTLRINQSVFHLDEYRTINSVWDEPDTLRFQLYIKEIHTYSLDRGKYLLIRLGIDNCNGLACSVDYDLIYKAGSASISVFGSFRGSEHPHLLDVDEDGSPEYLANEFFGDPNGSGDKVFVDRLFTSGRTRFVEYRKDSLPCYLKTIESQPPKSSANQVYWGNLIKH